MAIIQKIGDFILSSWIWQFTYDWFHLIMTGIVMFLLLRWVMRRSRKISFIAALSSQLISLAALSLIAAGILVGILDWQFAPITPQEGVRQMVFFYPSIGLGILYAILQSLFFVICSFFKDMNLTGYLIITWISNLFGAMISYAFIHMSEVMKYMG